jgi:spore germination protein GerM
MALLLTGCGLSPGSDVQNIDPLSLPPRLLATTSPASPAQIDTASSGSGVYLLRDTALRLSARTVTAAPGVSALQELLADLAAGPDPTDRRRGLSTALPPTTRLSVTAFDGDLATVDLSFGQVPPDQTTAIAQIVLTATSLPGVSRLLLTIDGEPLQAPLASGAQTDRPLTRADYLALLEGE